MALHDNFNPVDFLKVVQEIEKAVSKRLDIKIDSTLDGAWMRSAISRAYYSAFLTLRKEFLSKSKYRYRITNEAKDHETIRDILFKLPIDMMRYANDFENLRIVRNNADYDLPPDFQVNKGLVRQSFTQAQRIIANISLIMAKL